VILTFGSQISTGIFFLAHLYYDGDYKEYLFDGKAAALSSSSATAVETK
jgi:hypothetical protein